MEIVPEYGLTTVQWFVEQVSNKQKADKRKTAYKWFNELYFKVGSWNSSFIAFLQRYPGFDESKSKSPEEYKMFLKELNKYRDSLSEGHCQVKNELCRKLEILADQFKEDFKWLLEEDPKKYREFSFLLDDTYKDERNIIHNARSTCNRIYEYGLEENWHVQHYDLVVTFIRNYIYSSYLIQDNLLKYADSVGVKLLSIDEIDEILT